MNERSLLLLSIFFLFFTLTDQAPASEKSWAADFRTTVLAPGGRTILFAGKFYQNGAKVRFEPEGASEVDLYDFERGIGLRLFPEDRIYFESRLTRARIMRAANEGWISPVPAAEERRIFLREGTVKGRKAGLYLVIFQERDEKAYSLRWVTADPHARTLKAIYPASGYETIIVEYDDLREEALDPSHFQPPPEYLNLNPF